MERIENHILAEDIDIEIATLSLDEFKYEYVDPSFRLIGKESRILLD